MTDKETLEKIKALADKMYSRMAYLTTDTRPIRQAMDEYHQFIINEYSKEEPVSEQNLSNIERTGKDWKEESDLNWKDMSLQKDIEHVSKDLEETAIQFATDTETGKVDVVKQSSFFWGAIYHKQQMMAKAVEGVVVFDFYGIDDKSYGCIVHDPICLDDIRAKDLDKVKVIVIKED